MFLFYRIFLLIILTTFGQASAIAASCADYKEMIGQSVVDTPSGVKMIATREATVPIDDRDLYMDAIEEAEQEAKSALASFWNELQTKECTVGRTTSSKINITGEGKTVDVEKVKTIVCSLSNSTSELLRGVVNLGSCYTPGQFVRVTVGIKPETINQALLLTNQINNRDGGYISIPSINDGINNTPPTNVGGYSDDSRIFDF